MYKNKRVAVGLSGGVDSSFAAYILKKKGWDVTGFTLKFYPQENRCCDLESLYQARRLCSMLDMPYQVLDVQDLFRQEIISYFIRSYLNGLTPNPCAFCNRLIKFGFFFDKIKLLGFDYLATGHYARLARYMGTVIFKRAKDSRKSQEYFLSLVNPKLLGRLVFPAGDYEKKEVVRIAHKEKLILKERKESQDVCFVTDSQYGEFIERNISNPSEFSGNIQHVSGKILGKHKGIYYFTRGQRSGLGVSWKEPLYVTDIDAQSNTVIVAEKSYLSRDRFTVSQVNWFVKPRNSGIKVKIRYNSPFHGCHLKLEKNRVTVMLEDKVDAITPGQIAAFYHRDVLLGGGVIEREEAHS